jgi:hypothetical protein
MDFSRDTILFSVELQPWRWRQHFLPKRQCLLIRLHGVISQKTTIWTIIAVKKSELMSNTLLSWFNLQPWRWRQHFLSKRQYLLIRLHGVISQKTTIWTTIAVKKSEFMSNTLLPWFKLQPWRWRQHFLPKRRKIILYSVLATLRVY